MAIRLKDIAKDLSLSPTTVSKVLRDHPDVADETRKRVLKRMKELNYQPNLAARSLVTGQSWTIGLVVPDLLHPFFAGIAKEISTEVRKKGYSLFISSSDEDASLEQQEIAHMVARRVDVLVIASTQLTTESFGRIEEQKIPYILIDRQFPGSIADFVGVDDYAVGFLATSHLIEQGCRRIAHLRGPGISTAVHRLAGYRQALASCQMELLPGQILPIGTSGDHCGDFGSYEATMKLLAQNPRPDGIFCFNDAAALGAMRAILDSGLRIPEDLAVVGCGNLPYSDFLRVPLSSVDQRSKTIGKTVTSLALKLACAKKRRRPAIEIIRPHLIARASSLRNHAGARHRYSVPRSDNEHSHVGCPC